MATQQVALSYLSQAQAPALVTPSLDISLLNQRSSVPPLTTGFPNMPQSPSQLPYLQLQQTLRDQLQLASLAQNQYVTGLPRQQQQQQVSNQASLAAPASSRIALVEQLTAALLGQLAATQTNTHQNMVGMPQPQAASFPQQQSAAASLPMANQQVTLQYFPQAQAQAQAPPRTSNFDVSLLNRLSSVQTSPTSSLQPVLLDQMQLASLVQNVATRLTQVPSQAPTTAPASLPMPSLLDQLAAAQANQSSHLHPTSALANMYLLQQLSAPQNPLRHLPAYHNLPLQQVYAPQNPGAFLPIALQYQSHPAQSLTQAHIMNQINQMELHLQNMGANLASNTGNANRTVIPVAAASAAALNPDASSHGKMRKNIIRLLFPCSKDLSQSHASTGSTNKGTTPVAAAASAASSTYTHPIQSPENTSNNNSVARAANSVAGSETSTEATTPEQASRGQLHVPNKSKAKETRWLIRYEELKQFQQKYGHCLVPHGYSENRKLSWWVMNQRAQYQFLRQGKHAWLTEDRVRLLDILGFEWNPLLGKFRKGGK